MKIAVAGTGYVGLSLAVLLSQHNEVHAPVSYTHLSWSYASSMGSTDRTISLAPRSSAR